MADIQKDRDHTKAAPVKKKCVGGCTHPFQDERYGKGVRLMNPIASGGFPKYRCTVCSREQD